jgi:hypothetical protein
MNLSAILKKFCSACLHKLLLRRCGVGKVLFVFQFQLEQNKTASQDNSNEMAMTVDFNGKRVDLCKT